MQTLNRQRANIVLSYIFEKDEILTPRQVSQMERIFERDGALRWCNGGVIGRCHFGVRLETLLGKMARRHQGSHSVQPHAIRGVHLSRLLHLYSQEP